MNDTNVLCKIRKKLEVFSIGDPQDQFGFLDRLSRENRWSRKYAERVCREYLRFIFLAVSCDHHVTPSEQVDQAWHLHLLYTRSYWHDLCEHTLEQPLHHGPTKGGNRENAKFSDWYTRTLRSYQETFQEPPPADIWPSTQTRFATAQSYSRISSSEYFIMPKLAIVRSILAVVAIGLVSCRHPFAGISGSDFLMYNFFISLFSGGAALCGNIIKHEHSLLAKLFAAPLFFTVIAGVVRIYQGIATRHDVGFVLTITYVNCLGFAYCMDWLKDLKGSSGGSDGDSSGCGSGCGGCGGCGD